MWWFSHCWVFGDNCGVVQSLLGVWRQQWGGSVIVTCLATTVECSVIFRCLATTVGWFSHCWVFGDNSVMVQSLLGVWRQQCGGPDIVRCLATTVGWFSHC